VGWGKQSGGRRVTAKPKLEAWFLRGAVVLVMLSLAWMVWGERGVRGLKEPPLAIMASELAESLVVREGATNEVSAENWTDPALEAGDDDWVFDVFTPPVIFYNRETGRFSVTRPDLDGVSAASAADSPFGMRLVGVEPELYRLQIVGYAGYDGDEFGIFQNEKTGEGIVARAGERFDDLGLEIRTFDVRREDLIVPHSMPLREIVGVAEVFDRNTNQLVRLSSGGRRWTNSPIAEVKSSTTREVRRVQAGDRIDWESDQFEILTVGLEPTEVLVPKINENGVTETQLLKPESETAAHFDTDSFNRTP